MLSAVMPNNFKKHCNNCPYNPRNGYATLSNGEPSGPLFLEANSERALLIFQAPGLEEWIARKPISSNNSRSAAARIRASLARLGKTRVDFSITNSTQCYPGKENLRDKPPLTSARKCCSNWLKQDIEVCAYSRIIVFGSTAKKSVIELGYAIDPRLIFIRHPSGGLSNADLDFALKEDD